MLQLYAMAQRSFIPYLLLNAWRIFLPAFLLVLLFACEKTEPLPSYALSGRVLGPDEQGLEGIKVYFAASDFVLTEADGSWEVVDVSGDLTITPLDPDYVFSPLSARVSEASSSLLFTAKPVPSAQEEAVYSWFKQQQLPNGLLESSENGNFVSLYDNALAALVFLLRGDLSRAERIFDFFQGRLYSELLSGNGGFSQFRDRNGIPTGHRWMGDNAWLLIALNNYKSLTNSKKYDALAAGLRDWLLGLQDADGGLFAGYGADGNLLAYKVTEGNIDAFNAVEGYSDFHRDLLGFLERARWDDADKNLLAWPENPPYKHALDCHSWSFCIFEDYPLSTLSAADRFLNTQTATATNQTLTGYDFDEDREVVWPEGTGQMALAYALAGQQAQAESILRELEKALVGSPAWFQASGFPYAANMGSAYGDGPLWSGADTNIALSGGAWYIFALHAFNPFAVERVKDMPRADMFWLD